MFKRKNKEEKSQKRFLKMLPKKAKNDMRLVSQRKLNAIFIAGLVGFVCLSVFAIASNLVGNSGNKTESTKATAVIYGNDNVDYRLQQFLDGYVTAYFTVSDDSETRKGEMENLNSYYDVVPTESLSSEDSQPMAIVTARLQTISAFFKGLPIFLR